MNSDFFSDPEMLEKMMKELQDSPEFFQKYMQDFGKPTSSSSKNLSTVGGKDEFEFEINSMKDQLVETVERAREMEKLTKETEPFFPKPKNRLNRLMEYGIVRARQESQKKGENIECRQTFVTANIHSSKVTDLSQLKQIFINEMMVNKVHYGRYLICRVITRSYQIQAFCLLVEDENGNIEDLSIYNYLSEDDCKLLFPEGTVIYIKEPFLKLTASGKETSCIRVDSPSDIFIDDFENSGKFQKELNQLKGGKDPESLKKKGNDYHKAKQYDLALRCYKIGLALRPGNAFLFHLNCSAAFLELELYYQSYKESQKALVTMSPDSDKNYREKAYFRIGKAMYMMRQWKSALENFSLCTKENPQNKEALESLERAKQRLLEEAKGKYDFGRITKELKEVSGSQLDSLIDIADYFNHDLLMINQSKEKGKHIIAKLDIPQNTLLIVSKAFAYGKFQPSSCTAIVNSINLITNKMDDQSQYELRKTLYKRVLGNPYLAKEIYRLYSGDKFDREEKIPDEIVDISRLGCISSYNTFAGENYKLNINSNLAKIKTGKRSFTKENETGFWIDPSYLNHSCISNSGRFMVNSVMIIFSTKTISKGEEVTGLYEDPMNQYEERKRKFGEYGFACRCQLCKNEENNPNRQKIKEIKETYENDIGQLIKNKTKTLGIINSLENLYPDGVKFKLALLVPLKALAEYHFNNLKLAEAAKIYEKIYVIMKEFNHYYYYLPSICNLYQIYSSMGNFTKAEKWKKLFYEENFFTGEFEPLQSVGIEDK